MFVFCPFFMVCSLSLRALPISLIQLTNVISKKNIFILKKKKKKKERFPENNFSECGDISLK